MQTPRFIQSEDKEREEFLSSLGNVNPSQREIFHKLCRAWEPEIDYNRFLRLSGSGINHLESQLNSLIQRLKRNNCGLITSKIEEGKPVNDKIILTEEDDFRFYLYLVREEYNNLIIDPFSDFPSIHGFEEQGITIPDHYLSELDYEKLPEILGAQDDLIYNIPVPSHTKLLCTAGILRRILPMLIKKIQLQCGNADILEIIAKKKSTNLMTIKKELGSKDPVSWYSLVKAILAGRQHIEKSRKLSASPSLFQASYILGKLLEVQINEARKKKKEAKEMQEDLEKVVAEIQAEKEEPLDQLAMSALLDTYKRKYTANFEQFKNSFYENYTKPKERRHLPTILYIDSYYIHRDNVLGEFSRRFKEMGLRLRAEYTSMMEVILKTNNKNNNTVFYSRSNFKEDIRNRIAVLDPLLSAFFERPTVIAEAMISKIKKEKEVSSPEELKMILGEYFEKDTMNFTDPIILFSLDIMHMFEIAFSKLPLWKQIWLKLSGRYESYRESYIQTKPAYSEQRRIARQREKAQHALAKVEPGKNGKKTAKPGMNAGNGPEAKAASSQVFSREEALALRKKRKEGEKVKRLYSRKVQDEAWNTFTKSLQKKDN